VTPISADVSEAESEHLETLSGGELVYRELDSESLRFAQEDAAGPVLAGRMVPYGQWTEINSRIEGHFMERFAPGSLQKTMRERAQRIRVLFNHGKDFLGEQAIAEFSNYEDREDGCYYEAELLRSVPDLLVEGLRRGLYGSSVKFRPVKGDRVRLPKRSEHNPEGIEERTYREAYVKEFSVVTFPAFEGATAGIRSLTDEVAARELLRDPVALLEVINTAGHRHEPQHSEAEETLEVPEPSRSTQPRRDYLQPREDDPTWRL
jgi:HK97 family phage prohead protease